MSSSSNSISMNKKYGRIVLLVDMDCFYCQVEEKLDPSLKGKPVAVVQYNEWRGGGIIAVNYVARARGVTRHMRGDEAKEKCPDIVLVKVPSVREKADLNKYRDAGQEVATVLQSFTKLLYRASVDEAYLDLTQAVNDRFRSINEGSFILGGNDLCNTFAVGYANFDDYMFKVRALLANPDVQDMAEALSIAQDAADVPAVRSSDLRLVIAATIANEIRAAVKVSTGYECSAGIAHNKILAKLACGMHKPNKQTILPLSKITELFNSLPVRKIQGLGGKFGEELCASLGIRYLGELRRCTEIELQRRFDERNGSWLYNVCRGIDLEPVVARFHPKSIGCSKKFPGQARICAIDILSEWLNNLVNELCDRLDKDSIENNRKATQLVASYVQEFEGGKEVSSSRSAPLNSYDRELLANSCFELIKCNTKPFLRTGCDKILHYPIKFLGISVGKFEPIANATNKLKEMFANQAAKRRRSISEDGMLAESTFDCDAAQESRSVATLFRQQKSPIQELEVNLQQKRENQFAEDNNESVGQVLKSKSTATITSTAEEHKAVGEEQQKHDSCKATKDVSKRNEPVTQIVPSVSEKKPLEQELVHKNLLKERAQTIEAFFEDCADETADLEKLVKIIESSIETNASTFVGASVKAANEVKVTDLLPPSVEETPTKSVRHADLAENDSTETSSDYQTTYAEFAKPALCADLLQFQKCDICGAQISGDELSLQTHQDFHFAQQLSQQQRSELHTANRNKMPQQRKPSPQTSKKKASAKPVTSVKGAVKITKFFKSPDATIVPAVTAVQSSTSQSEFAAAFQAFETFVCDKCHVRVSTADMVEHQDFHLAKEVQRKLNRLEVHTVTVEKKAQPANKRARGAICSSQRPSTDVISNSITQYFSQPNILIPKND